MPQKHQTRPDQGRAGYVMLPGDTLQTFTLCTYRAQRLIGAYRVRADVAETLAALAYGGAQ